MNNIGIITPTCGNVHYGPHSKLYWLVDSGATGHILMAPLLQNKIEVNHDLVEFPYGSYVDINHIGPLNCHLT